MSADQEPREPRSDAQDSGPEKDDTPSANSDKPGDGQGAERDDDSEAAFVRRAFFLEGLRSLIKPVANVVEKRLDHVRDSIERSRQDSTGSSAYASYGAPGSYYEDHDTGERLLRPPGALEEELFLDRCARSAQCVSACPVQAIQVLQVPDDGKDGTPHIDPLVQACVVCDDLACMQVCPSGALQPVPRHLIHMGVAELRRDICLRTDGEDCQICVEKCPLGTDAIEIPYQGADVEVKTTGCVGCGICEMYCPTSPRAIVVREEG